MKIVYSNNDGIKTDHLPVSLWLRVLPRIEGKLPTTDDGRSWLWLRLDTITEITVERQFENEYTINVVANGTKYHPTSLLLDGNESHAAEFKLIELVDAAIRTAR
ncbi:hypothetical protein [Xanthomonas translucens]|uniref:hypothetical protein n=1 Tax=Xanthomonas campestris pv. translucens TaxID=343 RepID=UPI00083B8E3D|nr:hypothetical protein [Xanthomonas translucens]